MVVVRETISNDVPAALANTGDRTRLVSPGSEPVPNRPDTTALLLVRHEAMALAALAWAANGATGTRSTTWAGATGVHPAGRSAIRRLIAVARATSDRGVNAGTVGAAVVGVELLFFVIR